MSPNRTNPDATSRPAAASPSQPKTGEALVRAVTSAYLNARLGERWKWATLVVRCDDIAEDETIIVRREDADPEAD